MDKQDIIRMAKEAGINEATSEFYCDELGRMLAAAVEQERKEFAVHAIDIARKAIEERDKFWQNHMEPQIEIEVKEAILEEREACAKVCEDIDTGWPEHHALKFADAVRARGEMK
jgi:hypothetical protein